MQIEVKREDQQGPFVISDIREGRQNGLFPLESYRIFPVRNDETLQLSLLLHTQSLFHYSPIGQASRRLGRTT